MEYIQNDVFEGIVNKEEFLVLNHKQAFNYENLALIAIHDPNKAPHPKSILCNYESVLQVHFWDIISKFGEYHPISKKHGKKIKSFIMDNLNKRFLIHCSAGISRSAGVGKAVEFFKEKHIDKNYKGIDYHPRYSPNIVVFQTIVSEQHKLN